MTLEPGCDAQQLKMLRRMLLAKGTEIDQKLTQLLSGETVHLGALLTSGRPGQSPVERLRGFLALIDERLHALRDGRYGRCASCGRSLAFVALEQVPWATQCGACPESAGS